MIPSERIVITEFNKTLTIFNTTDDDSGVYEVKFTGLLVHPYSKKCEQDVLALLRHYPIAIPAHFYLHTSIPGKLNFSLIIVELSYNGFCSTLILCRAVNVLYT